MQTALLFTAVFRFVLGGIGGGRVSTSLSTSDELTPTEAVVDGCSFRCSQIQDKIPASHLVHKLALTPSQSPDSPWQ